MMIPYIRKFGKIYHSYNELSAERKVGFPMWFKNGLRGKKPAGENRLKFLCGKGESIRFSYQFNQMLRKGDA